GVLRADVIGADPSTAVRMNGARALMLRIVKKGGANTLAVAAGVERVAARVRAILQIPLTVAANEATYVREASHAATEALGLAMALAVLVVFPFLRDARATLISAIAIPTSLAATAVVMALLRFNLETITAATLTIVAVFLPIGLMTGTLGQFFRPFGITASVAVLTSLAVARTLSPMLAAASLRPRARALPPAAPQWYLRALGWSLR
ncbi:MAG: efflux RND transporter permease subunit, partial [Candidatus Velthaea sp.]